jgi:tetratricopeptide (TPR) repeat protein
MFNQFRRRAISTAILAAAAVVSLAASAFAQPATPARPATPAAGAGGTVPNPLNVPAAAPAATAPAATPTAPTGGAPGAADSTADAKQNLTEWLIGSAVADANSPQYKDVTDAIEKFKNGDLKGAREQLSAMRKTDSRIPPSEILIARLFALAQQLQPARMELERAVVAEPKDPEPYLLFAEVAVQDKRITDAESLLMKAKTLTDAYSENAKRKSNFDIRVNAGLAAVAEARSQWDSAQQYLQNWIKLDAKNASAHMRLGRTLFQLHKPADALKELNTAVSVDSNVVNPYIFMAQLYEEAGQHDDAKKSIGFAVQGNPKDLNVHLLASKWALATNEMKDAQTYIDAAMKIDSKSVDAMVAGGTIARMRGDLANAEKLLQNAVMAAPANLDASNQLALVLVESKDDAKKKRAAEIAQVNMRATTQGDQFSPEAYTTAAWVLYQLGNLADAEKIMNRVLQTQRISQDGVYYLARILTDKKENDKAIAILEQAIANPSPFAQREKSAELLRQLKADKPADAKK